MIVSAVKSGATRSISVDFPAPGAPNTTTVENEVFFEQLNYRCSVFRDLCFNRWVW